MVGLNVLGRRSWLVVDTSSGRCKVQETTGALGLALPTRSWNYLDRVSKVV